MTPAPLHTVLTRRERQIMDILYRLGRATGRRGPRRAARNAELFHRAHAAAGARSPKDMPDTRRRDFVTSTRRRFPDIPMRKSALRHLVDTFFDGSVEKVVGALLGGEGPRLSGEEN